MQTAPNASTDGRITGFFRHDQATNPKHDSSNAKNANTGGGTLINMGPYAETRIKDLELMQGKVSLSGILVNIGEDSLIIDDGTGQATIIVDPEKAAEFALNTLVRVLGIKASHGDAAISAEIIQDLTGIDKYLYNNIRNKLLDEKKEDETQQED